MLPIGEALRPLMPVVIMFPLIYLWAAYSQTDIINTHPRCYYMLSGAIFANITVSLPYHGLVNILKLIHTSSDSYTSSSTITPKQLPWC